MADAIRLYFTQSFSGHVVSFVIEAVDATGAGDGFITGLLQALLNQSSPA